MIDLTREMSPPNTGGVGGSERRAESGLSVVQDARLTSLAVRRGWLKGQRWPTDLSRNDLIRQQERRDLNIREAVMLKLFQLLESEKPRAVQAAIRGAIAAERQNQIDDLTAARTAGGSAPEHQAVIILPDNGRKSVQPALADLPIEERQWRLQRDCGTGS